MYATCSIIYVDNTIPILYIYTIYLIPKTWLIGRYACNIVDRVEKNHFISVCGVSYAATPRRADFRRPDERDRVHPRRCVPVRLGHQLRAALPFGRRRFRVRIDQLPAGAFRIRKHRWRRIARKQRPQGSGGRPQVGPAQHRRIRRQPRLGDHRRNVGRWG